MLLANILIASALTFDAGADLRIREEIYENVPGLPGDGTSGAGVLNPSRRSGYTNHLRFRPRVWAQLKWADKLRLYVRFADEFRQYVHPWNDAQTWPGEVILDNLFLEGKGLVDGVIDFTVGRQDINGLYGLDHLFMDGTPGDGSRSCYSDMARVRFHIDDDSTIDVFGLYNHDRNVLRFGTDRSDVFSMTGLGGGAEREMDDFGYGVIWGSKVNPSVPYQLFLLQKHTLGFTRKGTYHPSTRRATIGGKVVPKLSDNLSLQFEVMGQIGKNEFDDMLTGYSTYAGINWQGEGEVKPFAKFGYHFMSGSDDAGKEDGGHSAWDSVWARAVNDSEMFLYGTHYGAAWWSNMHYFKFTVGVDFGNKHKLTGVMGPMFAASQDGLGGGDGMFKGFQTQARYEFPLYTADKDKGERFEIFGHIVAEMFNPGNYFETEKPAYFIRWQVDFKF